MPNVTDGHVEIDLKRGFHYFEAVDANTTRYMNIFNTDPKLGMIPTWYMNYMMKSVCLGMMKTIQEKGKTISTDKKMLNKIEERKEFYERINTVLGLS